MPGGRKRKRTVAKESHACDFERTEEDSQLAAKKKPRKATRKLTDELAKNAEDSERCWEMSLNLTPKSVLVLSDDLADTCLLFLERGQNVCIKGSAKITALVGLAEVMGSILKPGHESVEIFSASTSSLLTLSECSKDSSSSKSNLKRTLQNALQRQPSEVMKKALVRARKAATVLLLKSLQTVEMKFVCSFQSFQDIFNLDLGKDASLRSTEMLLKKKTAKLGFIILEPDATRCGVLKVPDQWKAVGDVVQQAGAQTIQQDAGKAPVVLICGGKDIGKSTFARYLTNSLLNSLKELCFLECDLGQTEFTPPGLISFNKVSSPLLGPPFTHPQQPERSVFFGDVSPKDKPEFYIQCIQYVYQAYADNYKNRIPLVVNTQGWVRGMGVPLMIDVIRLVQPTHIIQFNYAAKEHANKNLPKITSDFLLETPGWTFAVDDEQTLASNHRDGIPSPESDQQNEQERTPRIFLDPVVLQIDTEEPRGDTAVSKFSASDHRTLALLAYFSRTKPDTGLCSPNEGHYSRPMTSLLSAVPYDIPWSQVALHVMHTEVTSQTEKSPLILHSTK